MPGLQISRLNSLPNGIDHPNVLHSYDERSEGRQLVVILKKNLRFGQGVVGPTPHIGKFMEASQALQATAEALPCTCQECTTPARTVVRKRTASEIKRLARISA